MERCRTGIRNTMAVLCMAGAITIASAQDKAAQMTRGGQIYREYCQTCHQATGKGLGTVYPPLSKSDYLTSAKKDQIIKDVVNGKAGKLKVNGKEYNGVMAPLPAKYSAADVAAVLTYVNSSFGNTGPVYTAAEVRQAAPKRK